MSQSSQAAPTVQDKPADLPAFEVATIKPDKSGSGVLMFNNTPDGIQVRGFTAQMLIRAAYGYDDDRISGGPNWIKSDPYDIEAKVAGADVPALSKMSTEQRRLMLQPLLAERFQLKVHRETQVRPIYQLIVAKSGLKLKPSSPAVPGEASQPKMQMGRTQLSAQRFPMTLLVQWLSLHAGRTVVDKTDAAGTYDFELQWSSDQGSGSASGGLEEPASAQGAYPSLFTALQEQLGLKLEPAKGPVETMVIDNIQKPELDGEGAPSGARVGYALEPVRLQNVAQTRDVSTASTAADAPTFAVSSVRPSGPDSPYRTVKFLPGGHFVAQGVTLRVLTKIAYDLNDDQLSGGPTSVSTLKRSRTPRQQSARRR